MGAAELMAAEVDAKKKDRIMEEIEVTESLASPKLASQVVEAMGKVREAMDPVRGHTMLIFESLWASTSLRIRILFRTLWTRISTTDRIYFQAVTMS